MDEKEAVIQKISSAFGANEFPGERFLQGSFEGCEPYDEVGPFEERKDWRSIDVQFLDAHYTALGFFSEAGFRYFLPAYLIADLNGELKTADPLFHLTHGFYDLAVEAQTSRRIFVLKSGKSTLMNPRRYGAITSFDYARYRLSVFTREEASAIVAYLKYKYAHDQDGFEKPGIQAALDLFWLDREQNAPTAASLKQNLAEEEEYLAAVRADKPELNPGAESNFPGEP
jgi:hypothetical protein